MANVIFRDADKHELQVTIREGHTILRAAKQGRVALQHRCGGKAQCTTCKVVIDHQAEISKPEDKELIRLGEDLIHEGMRLSCQTKVYGTVVATIPEDPYKARIRALLAAQRNDDN